MNYYTLETHLEEISKQDAKYELLNSVWKLNKKTLTNALTAVNFNFPHYSLHESSHSDTIISNIESFLDEERIRRLEPTDTWLILMSAYSHDIGMVILQKTIEESLARNTLHDYLHTLVDESKDQDLKESAQLLLDIQNQKLAQNKSVFDIRRSITLITGEFFRRNHYVRSQEILSGKDEEFKQVLSNFYSDLIPNRLLHLLGEVAYSHGSNFSFILDTLQFESNGISRDKVHPRFVACLLRLGDILDVDDKRFNPISERLIDSKLPKTSELHKIKHASVKHLLIKPNLIQVTVDCPEIQVYRIARQWFDWLEKEVEDQYKNWASIAPSYLPNNPPTISTNGIKVLFQSKIPDPELMNLRFSIKPQKAIEIFEGKGIYEDSSFVFLRELVQNALDANKIQLWKDIINGNYNEILYDHLKQKYVNIDYNDKINIHSFILFPDDIPLQILKNYQTDLFISWAGNKKYLLIKVVDRGCGISRDDLLRMTTNVGESRSKDLYFQELKKTLPYWLKPTGAFGIGLQSVFLIADSFRVKTKADNDISYEVLFNSSKNGEYSIIKDSNIQFQRGTTVEVEISEEKYHDAFGSSFTFDIIDNFDYFSSDDSQYISKIEEYINTTFKNIKELNVYITDRGKVKSSKYSITNSEQVEPLLVINDNSDIQLRVFKTSKNSLLYFFDIKEILGSQLVLSILDNFNNLYTNHYKISYENFYLVRDIPVKDRFYKNHKIPYFAIKWNLLNPDSDKILNIARSKLIQETKQKHDKILIKNILPRILNLLYKCLSEDNFTNKLRSNNIDEQKILISLYHVCQTAKLNNIIFQFSESFKSLTFPSASIIYSDNTEPVSLFDFIHATKLSFLTSNTQYTSATNFDEFIIKYLDTIKKYSNSKLIILYKDYFETSIKGFKLSKIVKFDTDSPKDILTLLDYELNNNAICVDVDSSTRQQYLKAIFKINIEDKSFVRRQIINSIEPYHKVLAVSDIHYQYHLGYYDPTISYIISPFKTKNESDQLIEAYKNLISSSDNVSLAREIKNNNIEYLVPKKLSDWIIKNSSTKSSIDRLAILSAYSELIAEALILNQ